MAAVEAVGALAQSLARGRERLNARFAQSAGRVDAERFGDHLREVVATIVEAVDRVRRDRVDAVVDAAYDISLDLLAGGVFDGRPAIVDGWRRILPSMAWLVAEQPRAAIASVTNAIYNVGRAGWVDLMLPIAPLCKDLTTFRAAGHVVAWRCGMAQHRLGALDSCATLPNDIASRALGVDRVDAELLRRLRDDPWLKPDGQRETRVVPVSGFRGFGGVFLTPPTVFTAEDGTIVACDREHAWSITADVFGSFLHELPYVPPAARAAAPAAPSSLPNPTSVAANATTTAVTIAASHSVFLMARP